MSAFFRVADDTIVRRPGFVRRAPDPCLTTASKRPLEEAVTRTDVRGPLLEASADRDSVWGVGLSVGCACGTHVPVVKRRCRVCSSRNPLARLMRNRRRVERWIGRRVDARLLAQIDEADGIRAVVQRYEKRLAQIALHPLPERRRREDARSYVKRCLEFIPYMFENCSPAPVAREIDDQLRASSAAISEIAFAGIERIVGSGTGVPPAAVAEDAVREHARRLLEDLSGLLVPYVEALKVMKIYHDRMVKAWEAARPIFERPVPSGTLGAAWAKVRATVNPIGPFLRLGTAIWQNSHERETLHRLEAEIVRFHEQATRFRTESTILEKRRRMLNKDWRQSLTKHVTRRLREHIAEAEPSSRQAMVDRVLAQHGFGKRIRRLRSTPIENVVQG